MNAQLALLDAPRVFDDVPPPPSSPWGSPQGGWVRRAAGIYECSTASHGGLWVSPQRRAAMPACKTFAGGNFFEEDSDWHLVALAFPEAFKPEHVEAAHRTAEANRKWAEADAWRAAHPWHVQSAMNLKAEDFGEAARFAVMLEADKGQLTLINWMGIDGKAKAAIVRGYDLSAAYAAGKPAILPEDCDPSALKVEDLTGWAATVAGRMLERRV